VYIGYRIWRALSLTLFSNRASWLWLAWLRAVARFRPACARNTTFLWLTVVLAAMCLRPDLGGVTSLVRALGLSPDTYRCLLHFFYSNALRLDPLTLLWRQTVERLFARRLVRGKGPRLAGRRPQAGQGGAPDARRQKPAPGVWFQFQGGVYHGALVASRRRAGPGGRRVVSFRQACVKAERWPG
jgi:hypothetical protein